jgi:hypothetical protein
MKVATVR